MALDSHLIHTCLIASITQGPDDPLGGPGEDVYEQVYSGKCRLVEKTERRENTETSELYFVTRYVLLLPPDANIREGHRVYNIMDEFGQVISGAYTIQAVRARRKSVLHHYSVDLERV